MTTAGGALAMGKAGGWQARLQLGFRHDGRRTTLARRRRYGPLSVQRPFYPEGGTCHVYLLHPPGGVVGGDSLDIDVELDPSARALMTTPGATKFYRSGGRSAAQRQCLRVADGASLEWLPQENIFFPGAEVDLETRIDLEGDARLALWEIQCLGRPAIGEGFDQGAIDARLSIYQDGMPLMIDRLRADADSRCRVSLLAGYSVSGTLLVSHAGDDELEACRGLLPDSREGRIGATLLDGLLVVRYLGNSTAQARRCFTDVWQALRAQTVGLAPHRPRIWAT